MWKGYSRGGRQSGDLVNAREVRLRGTASALCKAQITHLMPGPPCSGTVTSASGVALSWSERSPGTQRAKAEGEALAMGSHLWLWEGKHR